MKEKTSLSLTVKQALNMSLNLTVQREYVNFCDEKLKTSIKPKLYNVKSTQNKDKRVFLCVSWLPIAKNSSHILVFLKLLKQFSQSGYSIKLVVSGLSFESDRAASFLINKTPDELISLYRHVFEKVYDLNCDLIDFKFLVNSEEKDTTIFNLLSGYRLFFKSIKPKEDDVFLLTSGNLACRYADILAKETVSKVIVRMTNNLDNILRFLDFADKIIVQAKTKEIIENLESLNFPVSKVIEAPRDFVLFDWQKKSTLNAKEKDLINSLDSYEFKRVFLIVSSRFKDNIDLIEKLYFQLNVSHMAFITIGGVCNSIEQKSNYFSLDWSDNIFVLIEKLTQDYELINFALDSGGGYTNTCVALCGGLNIVPPANDNVILVPNFLIYKQFKDVSFILSQVDTYAYNKLAEETKELVENIRNKSSQFTNDLFNWESVS